MENVKGISIPMKSNYKLDQDSKDKAIDPKLYRDMIGSLLYLTTNRSYIIFSVCICICYQSNFKESHVITVKKKFRYLIDTQNASIWYSKQSSLDLFSYSNSDFAECKLDKKSTSGTY